MESFEDQITTTGQRISISDSVYNVTGQEVESDANLSNQGFLFTTIVTWVVCAVIVIVIGGIVCTSIYFCRKKEKTAKNCNRRKKKKSQIQKKDKIKMKNKSKLVPEEIPLLQCKDGELQTKPKSIASSIKTGVLPHMKYIRNPPINETFQHTAIPCHQYNEGNTPLWFDITDKHQYPIGMQSLPNFELITDYHHSYAPKTAFHPHPNTNVSYKEEKGQFSEAITELPNFNKSVGSATGLSAESCRRIPEAVFDIHSSTKTLHEDNVGQLLEVITEVPNNQNLKDGATRSPPEESSSYVPEPAFNTHSNTNFTTKKYTHFLNPENMKGVINEADISSDSDGLSYYSLPPSPTSMLFPEVHQETWSLPTTFPSCPYCGDVHHLFSSSTSEDSS